MSPLYISLGKTSIFSNHEFLLDYVIADILIINRKKKGPLLWNRVADIDINRSVTFLVLKSEQKHFSRFYVSYLELVYREQLLVSLFFII